MTTETRELDRLHAIKDQSQALGSFLDWLSEKGITLCTLDRETGDFIPYYKGIERILAEYFEIDLNKIEREKLAILEEVRRHHGLK